MTVEPLPMFPLGTVLLPSVALPLHVFEPRYRQLTRDCLEGTPEFGVVLIERGSEVGGGDVRTDIGTIARILEASELPDGRWVLGVVGTRRIRVERWHEDAPYPLADVAEWPDAPPQTDLRDATARVHVRLRRVLALRTELGLPTPPVTADVADDVVLAGYQLAALAPIGALDRQHLLGARSPEARLDDLDELLADAETVLEQQLAGG